MKLSLGAALAVALALVPAAAAQAAKKPASSLPEPKLRFAGTEAHVPAYPCEPKDLTGAGDMFAGAFLYGVTHGVPPAKAARAANFLAMKVITQIGARLHHGAKQFWQDALASA